MTSGERATEVSSSDSRIHVTANPVTLSWTSQPTWLAFVQSVRNGITGTEWSLHTTPESAQHAAAVAVRRTERVLAKLDAMDEFERRYDKQQKVVRRE